MWRKREKKPSFLTHFASVFFCFSTCTTTVRAMLTSKLSSGPCFHKQSVKKQAQK